MVGNMLDTVLSEIDPNVIKIVLVLLAVCLILAIIKKAIKIIISVVIVGALIFFLGQAADQYQDKYSIAFNEGIIELTIDGKEYQVGENVTDIVLERLSDGSYNLTAKYDDGKMDVTVPGFMKPIIIGYGELMKTEVEVID